MSTPSSWPLTSDSIRFVVPRRVVAALASHPLSAQLYPLGIGYYQHARGHRMQRANHDDNLLIYCLEGRGKLTLNGRGRTVKPGDLIILPRGLSHSYETRDQDPWSILWVHFEGELATRFIGQLEVDDGSALLPLGIHSRLVADFEALLDARQASHNLTAFIHCANQLRQLLTHIALLKPMATRPAGDSMDLETIHSLMQARLHEQLDIDTLAQVVNLSKFHFIKKYKALTGTTPISHFIHLKIERACHLLDVTSKGVNEVAWALGYDDAYYFSRIFKKSMGMSPSQYRRIRLGGFSYKN
ncbi:AraC family transcriptional regulator [Marinobacterium rhizophilum]|uniref:AraC family transcriptional regulator n=1 Tax=Marinobacterium rhizophilum TaxID=420402 RepID=A0ABY5HNH7_9GAMM|nr:AraC family transcriptional regulator [Marinobacterium rhizophilum]UTW13853.1 AraC family transcriptional regulator [Marinobacterium rhizophilum]